MISQTYTPLFDPKLLGLRFAQDDRWMCEKLSAVFSAKNTPKFSGIMHVEHRIIKHTPGKRCVLEYRLRRKGSTLDETCLIGKLYRGRRGERIFRNLDALWQCVGDNDRTAWMPRPLAYLPEPGMVLQA
ncbi:hypothetical protein MJD09_08470, partial [bacterium]|nr:hypothetical protein [bacterium]